LAKLTIISSGIYSSVQDFGRYNFTHLGVPISGVLDTYSAQFANLILGNLKTDAVIEITFSGAVFSFNAPTQIVVSGARTTLKLNDIPVNQDQLISIQKNDVLNIGSCSKGFRSYLAIKNGFKSPKVLGSRSFYNPVTHQSILKDNDELNYNEFNTVESTQQSSVKFQDDYLSETIINVYKGVDYDMLQDNEKEQLDNRLTISATSNRMAYQFEEILITTVADILTGPVLPGTVQLIPSGKLIVLMKDCQTTGGYARVLQVTDASLNCLAQKPLGSKVQFKIVDFK
jgi:biotin-dependent carboxylase-like uncharacterized protein